MCGIVGYIGNQKAYPILINGLIKLEYRGYDSAGISTVENGRLRVLKNAGRVNNLYNDPEIDTFEGTVGIAHTRWATHGKPSKENSHPHLDSKSLFSVVHNGIIENYTELKEFLTKKGYTFASQTDTEVIPNLISYYYSNDSQRDDMRFLRAVHSACGDLKGSYAIEVISKLYPDVMIAVRFGSPLVIGAGIKENYVASDIPAILSYTKNFYLMEDSQYAVITKSDIHFYNNELTEFAKASESINWDASAAEKDGFDDFMLKEIYEQPVSIRETIGTRIQPDAPCCFDSLNFTNEYLKTLDKIYIIGCGTAMHAGLAAKPIFEHFAKISTEVDVASEFRYRSPIINKKTLCLFISQSGETADTLAALHLAKNNGAKTIAVSNVIGSSITREADYTVYTHAGPEIAVASTKAYTAQVVLLTLLALSVSEQLQRAPKAELDSIKNDIVKLPAMVEKALKLSEKIKPFADKVHKETDIFFIGRGSDYATSLEASLKLKEISYIHSEAYASGELKHGPIALIEKGTTVIGTVTDDGLKEKSISNLKEVITRGAKVLIITNCDIPEEDADTVIHIPDINKYLAPVLSIIPYQLLSYYISKQNGLDVDKPRNLAKSVTVE